MRAWHHLVIEGPADTARSFVAGVLADQGMNLTPLWGDDLGLERHSLAERVKDLLRGEHHAEVFLPADVADAVVTALATGGAAVGLRVTERQLARAAQFTWEAETVSREAHRHIRTQLVEALPAGVASSQLQEEEHVDPNAAGTALYTPSHAFEYRGSGHLEGSLPGIIERFAEARTMDFVKVSPLTLDLAPL